MGNSHKKLPPEDLKFLCTNTHFDKVCFDLRFDVNLIFSLLKSPH